MIESQCSHCINVTLRELTGLNSESRLQLHNKQSADFSWKFRVSLLFPVGLFSLGPCPMQTVALPGAEITC